MVNLTCRERLIYSESRVGDSYLHLGRKTGIDFMKTNIIKKVEALQISSLLPILSPIVILLLFFSLRWSSVLAAGLFTTMVLSTPTSFRTRGGSLVPAICLAALGWLCSVVVFVFSFIGAH